MKRKKLKVLLLADYSNYHATLAEGLRELGCDVTVASDGSAFMECERDLELKRKPGKPGGLLYFLKLSTTLRPKLSGYDIVSLRDPACLDLKPHRIERVLRNVFRDNKHCFLSYISTDIPFLDMLEAPDSPIKYSEWFIDGKPNRLKEADPEQWKGWHSPKMQRLNAFVYENIQGAVTGLYEYHKAAERVLPSEKIAYGGIPIDLRKIKPQVLEVPHRIKIFLGRDNRRKIQKGSDLLEVAAKNVVEKYPEKAELVILENKPHKEYMEQMRACHVVLDQIYSYTPGTMALESMASGLTTVSGAEPEFYNFIGEKDNFPIVNAPYELNSLTQTIEDIVLHPERLPENSRRSREFVEKHNSHIVVAKRVLDFWNSRINP